MDNYFIIFLGICLVWTLLNWKQAFSMIIIVGFLQDPIRKLVPGEPVLLTTSAIALLSLVTGILFFKSKSSSILAPFKDHPSIKLTAFLFTALVLIQCISGYLRYGSIVMIAIGAVSYLGIFPALWVAWSFIKSERSIHRILQTYLICSLTVVVGIYLSFLELPWKILQQVGEGIVISSNYGNLTAHTGFMRSPEIAAWHIATGACILLILLFSYQRRSLFYLLSPIFFSMIGAGLLTGRRKALAEIFVFVITYFFLTLRFRQKKSSNSFVTTTALGILLALALFSVAPDNLEQDLNPYLERGSSVFLDLGDRFQTLGLQSIGWAINRFGYFGIGAGTAGLGMAHFGGVVEGAGGAGEGGFGKIVVELGLPGLILAIIFITQIIQLLWKNVKLISKSDSQNSSLPIGILSLLIANIPMFISSSLLFGDPFVLIVCGSLVGILLAISKTSSPRQPYFIVYTSYNHID